MMFIERNFDLVIRSSLLTTRGLKMVDFSVRVCIFSYFTDIDNNENTTESVTTEEIYRFDY